MSWVTLIWTMCSGACLTLALMHLVVWWKDQTARANLVFSVMAIAVAAFAVLELALMRAETPEQFGLAVRWMHVPAWVIIVSLVGFVRLYLRAGRRWLAWAVVGVRTLSLILNFGFSPNINYREITALRHIPFLGESVSVAEGVANPWMLVAQLSLLLLVIFVMDAAITVWRRGDRRQALVVSIVLFVVAATVEAVVITWGIISMPMTVSLFYQGIVAAMGYELSSDLFRAAQLAQRFQASEAALRESEARINLAANAANFGLWLWNIRDDKLSVTEKWRKLFGFAESEPVSFARLLQVVHPEDRERIQQVVQHMLGHGGGEYESEYRITRPDGSTRWIAGYGGVELDEHGKPAFARGVSRDITRRKIAEEELRESEARFRTVADAAPVMIWMAGTDKLCNFFNKGWLDFTGRTMEQELGNGWAEGVHTDDFQICLKTYVEAFDARQPFVMQYRLRRHDGEYRWISDNGVPRYDPKKNFVGYIGSCMDVTELLSKEKALREFEERVTLAARAAQLGVWEMDTTTNEIWMSDGARSLFQFEPGMHITYATFQDRVHPEDRAFRDTVVKQAIHTKGEYKSEYRTLLPDGTVRWIGGRGRCVADASGRLTRLIGVSMDVTERKEAQDLFRLATESSPSGIILANDRGHIILVNTHVEKLFGYRREELVGKPVDILVPERFARQHPAHRARFLAAPTARAMGAGRDLFGRRRDGSEFPVEIGLNPIRTAQGVVVLASVIDITARRQAELEHQLQNMELARVGRVTLMGELAASLAHEVNNPIGAIVTNANAGQRLIAAGKIEIEELKDLLADIVADGHRAREVIQGIRNMVRKSESKRSLIPITEVIGDLLRIVRADALERNVTISAEIDSTTGRVMADPVQLLQVLLNLTLNAFEAMSAIRLDARRLVIRAGRNGDGQVFVSVRDSGPGFPGGIVEQLFEPFFSTKAEGTGMGLTIARSIVEAHGGTLSGENCYDGGACFTVRLPQAKPDK